MITQTNFIAGKSNKMTMNIATITLLSAVTLGILGCQQATEDAAKSVQPYAQIQGETMGTSYHIRFQLPKAEGDAADEITAASIQASIDKELVAFNDELSTWQDDSTITKFNKSPANTSLAIDKHFYQTLVDSQSVYQQSKGAFDPTVKPIIELWGFGKEKRVDRLQNPPTEAERAQAKQLIDFTSISYEQTADGYSVNKGKDNVQVDFSAIAKGYGVDVIADVLKSTYQINNYMVEIGGEVATSGVNDKNKGWTIAVDAPILHSGVTDRKLIATISQPVADNTLGAMHLATSGNYRNSIVFDGVRYSHTIDPSTGNPVVGGAASVTVADESVALADAWATAFTAMPYEQALTMAQDLDKAVMFIVLTEEAAKKQASGDQQDKAKDPYTIEDWQIVETPKMKALRAATAP